MRPSSALCPPPPACGEQQLAALLRCLHDELAQALALALIQLDVASAHGDTQALRRAHGLVRDAMRATRGLLDRLAVPHGDADAGAPDLAAALRACVQELGQQCARPLGFAMQGKLPSLPGEVGATLLAAARELLVNACKHGAPGAIDTSLCAHRHRLAITVSNHGAGRPSASQELGLGHGLGLVQARLHEVGARLRWRSHATQGVQARITWAAP